MSHSEVLGEYQFLRDTMENPVIFVLSNNSKNIYM